MAYIIKVESGKGKLYDKGSFKRSVGSGVSAAAPTSVRPGGSCTRRKW